MSSKIELAGTVFTYIECDCGSADHIIRFSVDDIPEKYEPALYIDVQLSPGGFFYRLRNAMYYVFFGQQLQWSGSILNLESVQKIEGVFSKFKKNHRIWKLHKEGVCIDCEGRGGVSSCNICGKCARCGQVNSHKDDCHLGNQLPFGAKPLKSWSDYEL